MICGRSGWSQRAEVAEFNNLSSHKEEEYCRLKCYIMILKKRGNSPLSTGKSCNYTVEFDAPAFHRLRNNPYNRLLPDYQ